MSTGTLRDAWFLASKGIAIQLRARETLVWTFAMPLVFMFFIGTITSHTFGRPGTGDPLAVSLPPDAGFLGEALVQRLGKREYRVYRTTPEEAREFSRRLIVPPGFTDSVLSGKPVKLEFERVGGGVDTDYDRLRVWRAAYAVMADVLAARQKKEAVTEAAVRASAASAPTITMEVTAAGKRAIAPNGFEQSVPGTMVMFTLLVLFTSGAVTLTIERRMGLLRRLASTPISRGGVVLGRWGSRMALGAMQIVFAMIAGTVLFHIHWGPNLPMVLAILLAYGALAAALGMLLGNWGRTEGQVIGMGVLLSNVLAGLGGCWWPIEIAPPWAQKLAIFLPTGWTMDALHKLVNFGGSPMEVLPHLAASLLCAGAAGWMVARWFRFV